MSKAPQGKQPDFYSLGVDEGEMALRFSGSILANKSVRVRTGGAESVMTFASNGVSGCDAGRSASGHPWCARRSSTARGRTECSREFDARRPCDTAGLDRGRSYAGRQRRGPDPQISRRATRARRRRWLRAWT